jgi:hypothetical protein
MIKKYDEFIIKYLYDTPEQYNEVKTYWRLMPVAFVFFIVMEIIF